MKYNIKITIVLLTMFLVTQFIGLYVVNHYIDGKSELPFGMQQPEIQKESDYYGFLSGIIFAFVIAILLFFFLAKLKVELILRIWFLLVVFLSLSISFLSIISPLKNALIISSIVALALAIAKVFGRNFIVHNITEFFIYPGIASVFVPILNVWTIIALLLLISVYDIWAVWHSGIMQKIAKYQIKKVRVFSGFFVPYASKKVRQQIARWKNTLSKSKLAKKKIKVNVAILGGGDIVFPIIASGVMLANKGFISALLVIIGATLGLSYLFFIAKKRKFYPAMPYITAGILLGIAVSYLFF